MQLPCANTPPRKSPGGNQPLRPLRDLLDQLARLPRSEHGEIDFGACDLPALETFAQDAESVLACIQLGMGAIGCLLAHSAVVIEDGTVGADSLENLGFLMAEMGDLAGTCLTLAGRCRLAAGKRKRQAPPLKRVVPSLKPKRAGRTPGRTPS